MTHQLFITVLMPVRNRVSGTNVRHLLQIGRRNEAGCESRNPLHRNNQPAVVPDPLDVALQALEKALRYADAVAAMVFGRIFTQILQTGIGQTAKLHESFHLRRGNLSRMLVGGIGVNSDSAAELRQELPQFPFRALHENQRTDQRLPHGNDLFTDAFLNGVHGQEIPYGAILEDRREPRHPIVENPYPVPM